MATQTNYQDFQQGETGLLGRGEQNHSQTSFHSAKSDLQVPQPDTSEVVRLLAKVTLICASFMVLEFVGGYLANSVAVMSDALHLTIDIIGYAIQMASAKFATRSSLP